MVVRAGQLLLGGLPPKPYKFIGFGDIYGPKPYKFIRFGAMDVPKPYKSIGFGAMDVTIVGQVPVGGPPPPGPTTFGRPPGNCYRGEGGAPPPELRN